MDSFLATLRALAIAVCLIAMAACVSLPNPTDPTDIAGHVMVSQDKYDGFWKAGGPRIIVWNSFDVTSYKLRAWSRDRSFRRAALAQLYVETDLDEWLFLDGAYSGGVAYEVKWIDSEVDRCDHYSCQYNETVGINMSIDQLHAIAAGPGFDVRLSGRRGDVTFFVPAAYFQGFLRGLGQPSG